MQSWFPLAGPDKEAKQNRNFAYFLIPEGGFKLRARRRDTLDIESHIFAYYGN